VIAATNRPDILDPALMRSGRLDRKVELPHPTEEARANIMKIHSRKMNVDLDDVNFEELARSCDDFNGAQLKAVCVEAGMLALRRNGLTINHEDFLEGINQVMAKVSFQSLSSSHPGLTTRRAPMVEKSQFGGASFFFRSRGKQQ